MHSYAWRELVRNPRRTLAAMTGVALGVGLFSAVLFFIDGSGATMTARAVAPLALDMQRVLTAPLGSGLRLEERLGATGSISAGEPVTITLRVINGGAEPAHDVVVEDDPPAPLRYLAGTATLNGTPLPDGDGDGPFSQGVAGLGRNIGTVAPGSIVTISYRARAPRAVSAESLRPRARVSSRESLVPSPANSPRLLTLEQVRARIASIPGVASADGLAFVDLPPGSLRARGIAVPGTVRVFAFDRRYREHYPSIRLASGSFGGGAALLSAEAAGALRIRPGGSVDLRLPAGRNVSLPISGVADLASARPLFSSRRSRDLENFLYVPQSIVVSPATFATTVMPALRAASAQLGGITKSLPVEEVDVLVERGRLRADPAAALAQTQAVARSIGRIAPAQDYLIDNISNTLMVASADAAVGKRMFLFLGLPGASCWRASSPPTREPCWPPRSGAIRPTLRLRGAHRVTCGGCSRYRTLAVAGAGSAAGTAAGLLSARAILGCGCARRGRAPARSRALGLAALGGRMLVTGLALFVPGRRALAREIAQERRELALASPPAWRRLRLDVLLLAAAALAELVVLRSGALDAAHGSVFEGRAVSLPAYLLLVPLLAWVGGVLLATRLLVAIASRLPVRAAPGFGGAVGAAPAQPQATPLGAGRRHGRARARDRVRDEPALLHRDLRRRQARRRAASSSAPTCASRRAPGRRTAAYASRLRIGGVARCDSRGVQAGELAGHRCLPAGEDGSGCGRSVDLRRAARLSASSLAGLAPGPRWLRCERIRARSSSDAATADDLSLETGDRVRWCSRSGRHARPLRRSGSSACSGASPVSRARPTSSSAWPPTGRSREPRLSTSSWRGPATRPTRASPGRSPRCALGPGRVIPSRSTRPRRRSTRTSRA